MTATAALSAACSSGQPSAGSGACCSVVNRMSRYTDIELTSRTSDGSWTWRAAGARQPRGTVPADLVPSGGRVGDVLRAEIESGLEGVEVVSLSASRPTRSSTEGVQRIEVLGAPRGDPGVVVSLARGSRLLREGRAPERERRARREGPRREARAGGPPGRARDEERHGADERRAREDRRRVGPRRPGLEGGEPQVTRAERAPAGRRDQRPTVAATFRNAALATLRPEQLPVAEQLLRGGIPAVRAAIAEQNAAAKAAGQPPVAADALLAMAEELLPVVNLAGWKDRATAAKNAGRAMRLRELRAVVAASRTVSLDDEARALARDLSDSLNERVTHLRDEWQKRIEHALDAGHVLEALQVSARPPEAATRCPAELAVRLAQAASGAMQAETPADEWMVLLSAVVDSPVRRTVRPAGIPESAETKEAARKAAGLVPELAKLIGLPIPPPPPRRPAPPRRPLSPVSGGEPASGP
jgi:hypothetical protein